MRARIVLAVLMALVPLLTFGRPVQCYDMRTLVGKSKLVFIGRVKSVRPSGITTRLTYPTWGSTTFEWLTVEVVVIEPVKGVRKGDVVRTAMLSVEGTDSRPNNAPGMIDPKNGDALLLCLSPTAVTNLFAAFTAPYDEDESILRLDRNFWEYRAYREGKKVAPALNERWALIWSLVNEAGELEPTGAERMRQTYAAEIARAPSDKVIYLQWETAISPGGWQTDVPKAHGATTNSNGN